MKTTLGRSYLLLVAFSAASVLRTFAADQTVGIYRLNVARSSYTPAPNPVQDLTVTRKLSDSGVTQTTEGTLTGNVPFHANYTTRSDGAQVQVRGNAPFNIIAVKQVGPTITTDERMNSGGLYKATGRSVFTHHGSRMTVTIKGVNGAGKRFTQILVFDRQ